MLTRRGWAAALIAAAWLIAGRVIAVPELSVIGVAVAATVVISAAWVASVRLRLSVQRTLRPERVQVGSLCRVEVAVSNLARRATPALGVRDRVSGTPGARAALGPLPRGETGRISYALPTERRGRVGVGPLEISVSDPLGLARMQLSGAPRDELTVLPRILPLRPAPSTLGRDPMGGSESPNSLGRVGDEFYALRDYVVGDDLRRVHWPSTARSGDLMIRQDELPWQGRCTLLVDLRRKGLSPEGLDLAADLTASIATASARHHDLVRLVTTAGADSGFGTGRQHLDSIIEYMATVEGDQPGSLTGLLSRLRSERGGGTLVVIGPGLPATERATAHRVSGAFARVVTVEIHPSATDDSVEPPESPGAGHTVLIDGRQPPERAWNSWAASGARR